jgi:uncharacterized membrane protein YphA (DoxX/SURF4 family)
VADPISTKESEARDLIAPTSPAIWEVVGFAARVALGGLFIYMGLIKALDPVEFLKLLRQYDIIHQPLLLNSIAAGLPWFEVFCGLLLVTGIAVRGTALIVLVMLIFFTTVILRRAIAIHGLQGIPFCAIKFDCGCGAGVVLICHKIAENISLLILSLLALSRFGRLFCLRHDLIKP